MNKTTWHGFSAIEFDFEGTPAFLAFPETPCEGKPWTLKTEYKEAFPETEISLLKLGYHVAYLKNETRLATKADCDAKARFVDFLHNEYGLHDKCVPVGFSCGGAHAVNFAGFYPDKVSCMFIDAPVLNFSDFPGKYSKSLFRGIWDKEFLAAYPGMTRAKLFAFDNHPINKVPVLIENKIPVIMLYGTQDDTVIYDENGKLMELEYETCPELLKVIARENQGHHPHGLFFDNKEIIDFICANSLR